jgi:N6-L-threonylcarbamoyladenine synthase
VLVAKCALALERTGFTQLVVAGGVGANRALRAALDAKGKARGFDVLYPEPELCTDNGAMIALAAALRLEVGLANSATHAFTVRPSRTRVISSSGQTTRSLSSSWQTDWALI